MTEGWIAFLQSAPSLMFELEVKNASPTFFPLRSQKISLIHTLRRGVPAKDEHDWQNIKHQQ